VVASTAQEQVARMLELVPYLQQRDGIPLEQVADDFGVSPAQIVKDLKVLWFCGLPNSVTGDMIDIDMDALEGEGVVRLSNADYLTRPLRLAPHEALALVVALRTLREAAAGVDRDAVDRALSKLETAAGEAVAGSADTVDIHIEAVEPPIRDAVDTALHDQRRMRIAYYVPSRDETTERDVDPLRLIFSEGNAYLEAWCHRARENRLFRLDRMTAAQVLDVPAEPPADVARLDLSKGLFQPAEDAPSAVLDLAPAARWVADYYPVEDQEERADGRLRVTLRFSDPAWLERLVLRLGGTATLVEPAGLAADVRRKAAAALAAYS